MKKEDAITKTQRIKINSLEYPTQDWDEFSKIFEILQKETILASNKIISACNVYNALGKENGEKWLFDTYRTDKIRSALYQEAKKNCKFYYSGSFNMISDYIYKKYFSGKNSWQKKIEAGEGNPPMTYTDTIPLFVRGDHTKIECLNYERGFYSFQSSFLSPIAKKEGFDYVTYEYDENNKKKKIKHHIDVNETRLKFRFTVKKNGRLEELINNFIKENSEYKFGDSQLLRKKNKKTKRWDYWFMLAYSCPKKDPGKKLDENRVMGVDVGVVVPAYASINDMTYKKIPIGDNTIHKQKILDEKLRAEKQSAITYNLRDGHTHYDDYLNTQEGRKLPVKHCIYGSKGWKIVDGLEVPNCMYVNKDCFGTLQWITLGWVRGDIELVGLTTNICVISNALILRAVFPKTEITVDASCCAGSTPEKHKAALEVMRSCQINVIGE